MTKIIYRSKDGSKEVGRLPLTKTQRPKVDIIMQTPIKELIGKKIIKAEIKGIEGYDDMPYLFLTMEDGSIFKVTSYYDRYTGKSNDEYPRFIKVEELGEKLI